MEELMTLKQYMDNPYGKGSTIGNVEAQKAFYSTKFEALLKEHEDFKYKIFYEENNKAKTFYVLVYVPSESIEDLYYEVLIKLSPGADTKLDNIFTYNTQFFSNSPAFLFTHAYSYNLHSMLINDLDKKLGPDLHKEPKIRNTYKIVAWEKTIYIACLYIKSFLDDMNDINKNSKKYDLNHIFKIVESVDEKLIEYRKKKDRQKSKEKEKKLETRAKRIEVRKSGTKKDDTHKAVSAKAKIVGKSKIAPKRKVKSKSKIK